MFFTNQLLTYVEKIVLSWNLMLLLIFIFNTCYLNLHFIKKKLKISYFLIMASVIKLGLPFFIINSTTFMPSINTFLEKIMIKV